ncbi:MAG: thioredoxin family protein [Alphaproteobacteria bacterium]|nr:thioredoxin family protein [Alphaproteobacteria bacterium]
MKWLKLFFPVYLLWSINSSATPLVDVAAFSNSVQNQTEILFDFNIQNKWHIYAPYDQEFGEPLRINLNIPENIKIVEQSFSTPKNFNINGSSFDGYEKKAFCKMTLNSGIPNNISADISWQACANDECYSVKRTIKTTPINTKNFQKKLQTAEKYFNLTSHNPLRKIIFSLCLAFFGGIILNLMPCIFPVLSLKILSLIKTDKKSRQTEAVFYTFGVILSMLILAGILFGLRKFNSFTSWGFQMQSPWFVGGMLFLFIILSLLMLDIITLNNNFLSKLAALRLKTPKANAFLTGLLAVLIASPCSAPFMGAAIGFALVSPIYIYFPIFFCLGLGYALPFAILASYPETLKRILPKPGVWMNKFKKILSIPLILTCFWLTWVLAAQLDFIPSGKNLKWQPYSSDVLRQALNEKRPVFIDLTAKWCLTCLMNKQTTLESDTFAKAVKQKNILLLRADATHHDQTVDDALNFYGRSSVPLYIYYDGKSENYIILPQILTPHILKKF